MRGFTFDEIKLARVDVVEELDRPRVDVTGFLAQSLGRFADVLSDFSRQIDARRDLDDFLMPPLHRAVALPKVHEVPVRVAEDLHLDVLRLCG
jgi:hypothetical protein